MERRHDHDLVVIGLGAVGSWALDHAASLGLNCLGIERFEPGHDRGSSHGHTRVTRQAYFEHPSYVPLIRRSTEAIVRLETQLGVPLLVPCGTLLLGPNDSEIIERSAAAAAEHAVEVTPLSRADLGRRYPQFSPPPGTVGLLEPRGGYLRLEPSLDAVRRRALSQGAQMRSNTRVRTIDTVGEGVTLSCEDGEIHARAALVCAGPWTARLLPELRARLRVTRQLQGWVQRTDGPALRSDDGMPCWLMDRLEGPPAYGIPIDPARADQGSKIAIHGGDDRTDPDALKRLVSPEERRALAGVATAILGPTKPRLTEVTACMYTNTPDEHMLLDRSARHPNVTFVAGLSGHGFKMAPALAKAAVDLALDRDAHPEAAFLGVEGRPVFEP